MSAVASTSGASGSSNTQPKPSEQELTAIFRSKTNELQNLVTKIGELEREADEHGLVIETLEEAFAADPDRKCFRLIGGILTERTVKDVLPELQSNHSQIKDIMEKMLSTYKAKETEFGEWQRANNIVVRQR
ncbi:Prefoldin [Meredithblackwellia eburnea MCA 4105]